MAAALRGAGALNLLALGLLMCVIASARGIRDAAALVLCMTGCAMAAFIPPAYFAGISTTRHMVGSNLATLLALTLSVALAVSMGYQPLTRAVSRPATPAAPGDPAAVPVGPASAG
jgi:hypothetical protein